MSNTSKQFFPKLRSVAIIAIAITMSFFSALLVYAMFSLSMLNTSKLYAEGNRTLVGFVSLVFFCTVWLLSSLLITHRLERVPTVLARGFLLWASEWLGMVFVLIVSSMITTISSGSVEKLSALSMLATGIELLSSIGFCLLMAAGSLMGYAVTIFFPKELLPAR